MTTKRNRKTIDSEFGEISQHSENPRKITPQAMQRLTQSLERDPEIMRLRPIVIDQDNQVLAGNQRLAACLKLGMDRLPDGWVVRAVDLTPEAQKRFMLLDNSPDGVSGTWDIDILQNSTFFDDLGGVQLPDIGFPAELWRLCGVETPDRVPEDPRLLKNRFGAKCGQIWQLGKHRLLCGDATDPEAVKTLLAGHVPHLMVTDPPYGVEYDPEWRQVAGLQDAGAYGEVHNDDKADWREAWELFPGNVAYVWHAGVHSPAVAESLQVCGFILRALIVWDKGRIVIGRGNYHHQHEPLWYAVRKGRSARFTDDRTESTVWEIPKPQKNETGHSTQKPVECMSRPMRNHICTSVYDPFVGSGTSIIAAEEIGRTCYAMEIASEYVELSLQRWEEATGIEPVEVTK